MWDFPGTVKAYPMLGQRLTHTGRRWSVGKNKGGGHAGLRVQKMRLESRLERLLGRWEEVIAFIWC